MSLEVIKTQMRQFLASKEPEVLAIRGDWGVGKTFTWEQTLTEAQALKQSGEDPNAIVLNYYSYVSLFGVSSLQDLRTEIAFNKLNTIDLKHAEGITKFQQASGRYMPKILSQVFKYAGVNTGTLVDTMFASMSNSMIRNTIVCIDDFERSNIQEKETLGLINDLKCKRGCKVVLLLNANKTKEYKSYREKVIDYDLHFKLTPYEATRLVFGENHRDDYYDLIEIHCHQLGTKNIRVIKKIRDIVDEAVENHELGKYNLDLRTQFIQSAVLSAYCFYEHSPNIPPLDYIRNEALRASISVSSMLSDRLPDDDELTEEQKAQNEIYHQYEEFLRLYEFHTFDKFDDVVFSSIEQGFINKEDFKHWAEKRDNELTLANTKTDIREIIQDINCYFLDEYKLKSKIEELNNLLDEYIPIISKNDLNQIYRIFETFGYASFKERAANLYIDYHKSNPKMLITSYNDELRNIDWIKSLKIRLDAAYKTHNISPSAISIIDSITDMRRTLIESEINVLNNLNVDEIIEIIDNSNRQNFTSRLEALLKLGLIDSRLTPLRDKSLDALQSYAQKSKQAAFVLGNLYGDIFRKDLERSSAVTEKSLNNMGTGEDQG